MARYHPWVFTKSSRVRCPTATAVTSAPLPPAPVGAAKVAAAAVGTALVIIVGPFLAPTAAQAGPNGLASVVLADVLPGLVANPLGPTNGPINKSNVGLFGGNGGGTSGLAQHLADGDVSGELRFWVHHPPDGDGVVISAFQFKDPKQVGAFLAGLDSGFGRVATATFSVPGILGGSGYSVHVSASGTPSTAYIVTFAKGSIDFEVQVITASGDLTKADARAVATRQAANAPGGLHAPAAPAGTSGVGVSEIAGYVLLGIAVVALGLLGARLVVQLVARRSRTRRRPVVTPAWHAFPPPIAARERPPAPPREVGWHLDPDHLSEQAYWDGGSWTARRRWSGATWVEDADEPHREGGPPG
jgi:hypothetical protein